MNTVINNSRSHQTEKRERERKVTPSSPSSQTTELIHTSLSKLDYLKELVQHFRDEDYPSNSEDVMRKHGVRVSREFVNLCDAMKNTLLPYWDYVRKVMLDYKITEPEIIHEEVRKKRKTYNGVRIHL